MPGSDAETVGQGTPASCSWTAVQAAVQKAGFVRFDCGPAAVTIADRKSTRLNSSHT